MENLVSIIIPCYNQSEFLNDCLTSVYLQTYSKWECIVIDDGSNDDTRLVAEKWQKKDTRFKYYYKQNGGLASARNLGLFYANGSYIQFLDSDDTIHHRKLEIQLGYFTEKIDIVICDYFPFDNELGTFLSSHYVTPFVQDKTKLKDLILNWEYGLSIPCHCVLFKSNLLEKKKVLFFDERLKNHEDWCFWVQLFYRSKSIDNAPIALANYRKHSKSMCMTDNTMDNGFNMAIRFLMEFFKNEKKWQVRYYLVIKHFELKSPRIRTWRRRLERLISVKS